MTPNTLPDLDLLNSPVPGSTPCGEDLSFSSEFDQIQEARRQDDPSLDQGEWITAIKEADWKQAAAICQQLLCERTKDLRLASWLTEALSRTHGIAGMTHGFQVLNGLIDTFWDEIHPQIEDGDQEQRIGNIAWLISCGIQLAKDFPVVQHKSLRYSLADLDAARALQSLINRHQDPGEDTGRRITLQQIRDAQRSTPRSFYQQTLSDCEACSLALTQLAQAIDARLGLDGPSFTPLRTALETYSSEIERLAGENGVSSQPPALDTASDDKQPLSQQSYAQPTASSGGPVRNREQALLQLREVAEFFRRTEPHSPVAYLADKAASWGEMPLHIWLKTVLKEEGALSRFEDLLGFESTHEA